MKDIQALRRVVDFSSGAVTGKHARRPPGGDRRKAARHTFRTEGAARLIGRADGVSGELAEDFPIITLSLSRTGLSFVSNCNLVPEDLVEVVIPAADGGIRSLRLRIIRSKRAGLNAYENAGEFAEE